MRTEDSSMNYSCFFGILDIDLPEYRVVILSLYAVTGIPAIILNSLVLYSIWKTPRLHKPSYVLLASLALSDLLNGSIGQYSIVLTNIARIKGWSTTLFCYAWIGGRAMSYWMASVSLYTLVIISIDRLLAIKKKTRYRSIVTMKRIIIILVEFWVKSFVLGLVSLFNFDMNRNLSAYFAFLGTGMFLMLSTITISYSLAYYYLKKATHTVSPSTGSTSATNIDITVAKYRKSLNTMILIFVTLILFYSPFVMSAITAVFYLTAEKESFNRNMGNLFYQIVAACEMIAFLNSTANPIMYLWRMRDIRQEVIKVVRKILRRQVIENRERENK